MKEVDRERWDRAVKAAEEKKIAKDPAHQFNLRKQALIEKLEAERPGKIKKLDEKIQYNVKELKKREAGGWQAKVFEDAIKRLNKEKQDINEMIEKVKATPPGALLPGEVAPAPRLFGLPQPLSDLLYLMITLFGLGAIGTFLWVSCVPSGPSDITLESDCIRYIKGRLRDPGSFQYISGTKSDDNVTIKYRAKNGFGGFSIESQTCSN